MHLLVFFLLSVVAQDAVFQASPTGNQAFLGILCQKIQTLAGATPLIVALGAYDSNQDGFATDKRVGIYTGTAAGPSDNSITGVTTVPVSTTLLVGSYRYVNISPRLALSEHYLLDLRFRIHRC